MKLDFERIKNIELLDDVSFEVGGVSFGEYLQDLVDAQLNMGKTPEVALAIVTCKIKDKLAGAKEKASELHNDANGFSTAYNIVSAAGVGDFPKGISFEKFVELYGRQNSSGSSINSGDMRAMKTIYNAFNDFTGYSEKYKMSYEKFSEEYNQDLDEAIVFEMLSDVCAFIAEKYLDAVDELANVEDKSTTEFRKRLTDVYKFAKKYRVNHERKEEAVRRLNAETEFASLSRYIENIARAETAMQECPFVSLDGAKKAIAIVREIDCCFNPKQG